MWSHTLSNQTVCEQKWILHSNRIENWMCVNAAGSDSRLRYSSGKKTFKTNGSEVSFSLRSGSRIGVVLKGPTFHWGSVSTIDDLQNENQSRLVNNRNFLNHFVRLHTRHTSLIQPHVHVIQSSSTRRSPHEVDEEVSWTSPPPRQVCCWNRPSGRSASRSRDRPPQACPDNCPPKSRPIRRCSCLAGTRPGCLIGCTSCPSSCPPGWPRPLAPPSPSEWTRFPRWLTAADASA